MKIGVCEIILVVHPLLRKILDPPLDLYIHLTLKMTQVVETSVTNNSSFQNYPHPDDHTIRITPDTPVFKPFAIKNKKTNYFSEFFDLRSFLRYMRFIQVIKPFIIYSHL